MRYDKIYNKLYEMGYHSKGKNHGKRFCSWIMDNYKFSSIIEGGCADGQASRYLQDHKKLVYAFDVSTIAVRYAGELNGVWNTNICSATDIVYKDKVSDAFFSCDMLEHLINDDAERAVKEVVRVTKKYIFVTIDAKPEGNREWIKKLHGKYAETVKYDNLHMCTWSLDDWIDCFKRNGADLINQKDNLLVFVIKG